MRRQFKVAAGVSGTLLIVAAIVAIILWPSSPRETVLVVLKTLDNPYYVRMKQGVDEASGQLAGIKVRVDAYRKENDTQGQIRSIESALKTTRLMAVCIAPADSEALAPWIATLNRAKVPVVVVDTRLDAQALAAANGHVDAFVGSNNREGGRLAAQYIGSQLGDTTSRVLILQGVPEQETARSRMDGFLEEAKRYPKWQIDTKTADWDRTKGKQVTAAFLAQHGTPAAIFASNDEMAIGAIRAIEDVAPSRWPVIVGFDATADAMREIRDGKMAKTVEQKSKLMGSRMIELAWILVQGGRNIPDELIEVGLVP